MHPRDMVCNSVEDGVSSDDDEIHKKVRGDVVGISGLNEGMLVGLDWGTWVSRRAQIQQ